MCRRASAYRDLPREDYEAVLEMLSEGIASTRGRHGAYLHRDRVNRRLKARKSARLTAITCGGAIPEIASYRVVIDDENRTTVGTLDEDFAVESNGGDIFLLGNNSWRIKHVRGGEVVVVDAQGAPPTIPFWRGEAPGRTIELSAEVARLREEVAALVSGGVVSVESSSSAASLDSAVAPETLQPAQLTHDAPLTPHHSPLTPHDSPPAPAVCSGRFPRDRTGCTSSYSARSRRPG